MDRMCAPYIIFRQPITTHIPVWQKDPPTYCTCFKGFNGWLEVRVGKLASPIV